MCKVEWKSTNLLMQFDILGENMNLLGIMMFAVKSRDFFVYYVFDFDKLFSRRKLF